MVARAKRIPPGKKPISTMPSNTTPLGIDPTVDFAFKLMLGSPDHTVITTHFLNAVLGVIPPITRVNILNPILEKGFADDKYAVLDVRAEDDAGRQLDIEMQTKLRDSTAPRLAYYTSRLYLGQLKKGDDYSDLRPAISICLLKQSIFPERPQLHLSFQLRDEGGLVLTDKLQIHLIQLSMLRVTAHNVAVVSALEQWAFFFLNAERLSVTRLAQLLPAPVFHEALGVLEMISKNSQKRALYEARLKFERDQAAALKDARNEGFRLGESTGEARGEAIGKIMALEQILGISTTGKQELAQLTIAELETRVADLLRRFQA